MKSRLFFPSSWLHWTGLGLGVALLAVFALAFWLPSLNANWLITVLALLLASAMVAQMVHDHRVLKREEAERQRQRRAWELSRAEREQQNAQAFVDLSGSLARTGLQLASSFIQALTESQARQRARQSQADQPSASK